MRHKGLLVLLFLGINAEAAILGYVTGNDYLKMDNRTQASWVLGVMDGIMAEAISNQKDNGGPWLGKCAQNHDKHQLKAIFEKELNSTPENWHVPAALIFQSKMKEYCDSK